LCLEFFADFHSVFGEGRSPIYDYSYLVDDFGVSDRPTFIAHPTALIQPRSDGAANPALAAVTSTQKTPIRRSSTFKPAGLALGGSGVESTLPGKDGKEEKDDGFVTRIDWLKK
jgi:hypothetical protein